MMRSGEPVPGSRSILASKRGVAEGVASHKMRSIPKSVFRNLKSHVGCDAVGDLREESGRTDRAWSRP